MGIRRTILVLRCTADYPSGRNFIPWGTLPSQSQLWLPITLAIQVGGRKASAMPWKLGVWSRCGGIELENLLSFIPGGPDGTDTPRSAPRPPSHAESVQYSEPLEGLPAQEELRPATRNQRSELLGGGLKKYSRRTWSEVRKRCHGICIRTLVPSSQRATVLAHAEAPRKSGHAC